MGGTHALLIQRPLVTSETSAYPTVCGLLYYPGFSCFIDYVYIPTAEPCELRH